MGWHQYDGIYRNIRVAACAHMGGGIAHGCGIPGVIDHDLTLGGCMGKIPAMLVTIEGGLRRLIIFVFCVGRRGAGTGHCQCFVQPAGLRLHGDELAIGKSEGREGRGGCSLAKRFP